MFLFADRLSTDEMKGNQLRLYFSSLAYTLMEALRRLGLAGTEWAQAQVDTIRLKLFKIGAIVRISVRRIMLEGIAMESSVTGVAVNAVGKLRLGISPCHKSMGAPYLASFARCGIRKP